MSFPYIILTLRTNQQDFLVAAHARVEEMFSDWDPLARLDTFRDARNQLQLLLQNCGGEDPAETDDPAYDFEGIIGRLSYDWEEDHTEVEVFETFDKLLPGDRRLALSEWLLIVHGLYLQAHKDWELEHKKDAEAAA